MTDERTWVLPKDRIRLPHIRDLDVADATEQSAVQLKAIIDFAKEVAPKDATEIGVEVIYTTAGEEEDDLIATYDAVLVDVSQGIVIATYPPYALIDSKGKVKTDG